MKDLTTNRIILENNIHYSQIQYKNEKDLETFAIKNKYALFGEKVIYFDIKKIISSSAKISKIPDGLFLTTNSFGDAKLWLVEYELSNHDAERHIIPQVLGFVNALKNESTKKLIKEWMYKAIKLERKSIKKIKSILPADGEIYRFLELVLDRKLGIVIVIDKKTPELEEVVDSVSTTTSIKNHILEFITYENKAGKKIHILDTLSTMNITTKLESRPKSWESRFKGLSPENKESITKFIYDVKGEFQCVAKPWYNWYGFYTRQPAQRKTLFAVIIAGKDTSSLCFRVDPLSFKDINDSIRKVKGFFFPTNTERRIYLNKENSQQIMQYLRHSHKVTEELFKTDYIAH